MPLSVASFENAFSHLIGCCFFLFVCLFFMVSLHQKDLLEKRMAIHSSILDWRISWTEAAVHGVIKNQTRLSN